MLFVVTYDEHGGFFDHVPPPGTPQNPPPPEFEGPVPRIHPDGPEHLGVRVPALIISPYLSGGSVCKTVFDHTSILKTILVRHRNRISSEFFTSFGERVNKANHLGIALDLDDPRTDPLPVPMAPPPANAWNPHTRARPTYPIDGDTTDFHAALCRAMLPMPRPRP
jgi:phospholipase C